MKKNDISLIFFEICVSILLLMNNFIKDIMNELILSFELLSLLFISYKLFGFRRDKILYKKKIIVSCTLYSMSFLIILYGLGLLTGYLKNPYIAYPLNLIKNILPLVIFIIIQELFRYVLCNRKTDNFIIKFFVIFIFTISESLLVYSSYDFLNSSKILEFITIVIVPNTAKSYVLCDLTRKYQYELCIIYQFIMNLYIYLLPIVPNFDLYLKSILLFVIPILFKYLIDFKYQNENKKIKQNSCISKVISVVLVIISIIIVSLYSNLFSFWIAVVGSGSMVPTINIGDAIIIDKRYSSDLEKLKKGDILVFKIKDSIYTHRIINITNDNGNYSITTQGDRIGNSVDDWVVTNDDVVGIVRFKIPYIGYPSIWIRDLLKGN